MGPLFPPNQEYGSGERTADGSKGAGGPGSACSLLHISPHSKNRTPPPPALVENTPYETVFFDGLAVDTETGECSTLLSSTEILYIKGGERARKYWLQVYHNDLKIKKPCLQATAPERGKRTQIFDFTQSSCRRLLFVCRNSGHLVKSQFLCSFHNSWPLDGKSLKKMLAAWIKRLKRKYGPGFSWLWCLEFQERSAPHIHFYSEIEPTAENALFLADSWLAVSGQTGDQECHAVHRHPANFMTWEMKNGQYLAKEYIGKAEQKQVPAAFHNVGRFWANSVSMKPDFSTIDPLDHDEAIQDLHRQAVRAVSKCAEHQKDHFKTFGCLFAAAVLDIAEKMGVPAENLAKDVKKSLALAVRYGSDWKTHRLRPPTNYRRKKQSYNLPNMAPLFLEIIKKLQNPLKTSGFLDFSRRNTPPAQAPVIP